jgi:hypothetical protein
MSLIKRAVLILVILGLGILTQLGRTCDDRFFFQLALGLLDLGESILTALELGGQILLRTRDPEASVFSAIGAFRLCKASPGRALAQLEYLQEQPGEGLPMLHTKVTDAREIRLLAAGENAECNILVARERFCVRRKRPRGSRKIRTAKSIRGE